MKLSRIIRFLVQDPSIYNKRFWLLCLSYLLFFGSFNMILPELPDFLRSLGGGKYLGLIIPNFALMALLSRPFSGRLVDVIGRKPIMVFGVLVGILCTFLYPFFGTVFLFLLLRFFHGISAGFTPIGTSAYIADIIPQKFRGEAMGLVGVCTSLGMAGGPPIGSYITELYSIDYMFYLSGLLSIVAFLLFYQMQETLEKPEKIATRHFLIKWKDVFEPRVLPPSIIMLLTVFGFGLNLTLVPDMAVNLGLNKGIFFAYFTIASISVRLLAGKASDLYGRIIVLKISCLLLAIALVCIGYSNSEFTFLGSACILGLAVGMISPTVFAWTVDLSNPKHFGRGLSMMFIFLELGIILGGLIPGTIYANHPETLPFIYLGAAFLSLLACGYLFLPKFKKPMLEKDNS